MTKSSTSRRAEQRHYILAIGEDHQLVREAAHPLGVLDVLAQSVGHSGDVAAVFHMERAAGKAVGVHHVGQRRGVVNEIGFVGGEVQHIVQIVASSTGKAPGALSTGLSRLPPTTENFSLRIAFHTAVSRSTALAGKPPLTSPPFWEEQAARDRTITRPAA